MTTAWGCRHDRPLIAAFSRVVVPDGAGVSLDAWRLAFYSACPALTPHGKKLAFQRVRTDLVNAGHLLLADGVYHPKPAKSGGISE